MLSALSTRGAQNLTATRIRETIAQVNTYLTHGAAVPTVADEDDDTESDSD
jgi:hypothetical protein